jgi:hypothetical protein
MGACDENCGCNGFTLSRAAITQIEKYNTAAEE